MLPQKWIAPLSVLVFALAIGTGGAPAGERADLIITNSLDQEIVTLRVEYSTPYDEPRIASSQVFLSPGNDYRLGVQGVLLPQRIMIDLATKTYRFPDLSGLKPTNDMRLEVAHLDGHPILRRSDAENAEVRGEESDYLTAANRPNAVDRDFLTNLTTMEEVRERVEATVDDKRHDLGEMKSFDIEAGPIWNNDHARERCPEVASEWSKANGREARWNGNWATTVPNEMSVCGCVEGTVGLPETLFEERLGWGDTLFFPVFWMDAYGAARVQAIDNDDPEQGIGFDLRFRLPESGVEEMLDNLMSDLRVDGFRPWSVRMRARDEANDEAKEFELAFSESEGDKYDHQDALQERLFAAYADSTLIEATAIWVKEEAFEKAKAGEERPADQGVILLFSRGTFEAVFVPDGRILMW